MEQAPTIYRLLATYWDRYDALTLAMARTDDTEAGTPEHEAATAAQFKVGDLLDEATEAICAFVPAWKQEARIKTDFISHICKENGGLLHESALLALLSSMECLVDGSDDRRAAE